MLGVVITVLVLVGVATLFKLGILTSDIVVKVGASTILCVLTAVIVTMFGWSNLAGAAWGMVQILLLMFLTLLIMAIVFGRIEV